MNNSRCLESYPDMLTPEECMNFFQIGRNTIYQLLGKGIIPSLKLGKQYRIPKKSLLMYIDSCYTNNANSGVGDSILT